MPSNNAEQRDGDVRAGATDPIAKPTHYTFGAIEVRDAIVAWDLGFVLGNVVKYVARAGRKGDALEDLRKAHNYLEYEIARRGRK
jgi:hypothetical protein